MKSNTNKPTSELIKLFEGKNTHTFNETTPKGNNIQGKILLNHGEYHGSLLITRVNKQDTNQFIRGFPKIKYYEENIPLSEQLPIVGYEKLDGTCIGFYQLKNNEGKIIEIVPKSRQKPVIDSQFMEMLKHCQTYLLYNKSWTPYQPPTSTTDYPDEYGNFIIFCELYGMLNEHTIPHKQTYIDLRLIGASRGEHMLPTPALEMLSRHIQIPLPKKIIEIKNSNQSDNPEQYSLIFQRNIFDINNNANEEIRVPGDDFNNVIRIIKDYLDNRNQLHKELHGTIYYEGIVLQNCYDGYNHYIKVKPDTYFEAEGKTRLSVPINEIRKEIVKVIKENITEFNEQYNENHTLQLIQEMLLEEYSPEDVNHTKTRNVIKKELRKYIDSTSDKSINKIVDEILENNDTSNISDLMRYFATHYPLMKHKSSNIHQTLTQRIKKKGQNSEGRNSKMKQETKEIYETQESQIKDFPKEQEKVDNRKKLLGYELDNLNRLETELQEEGKVKYGTYLKTVHPLFDFIITHSELTTLFLDGETSDVDENEQRLYTWDEDEYKTLKGMVQKLKLLKPQVEEAVNNLGEVTLMVDEILDKGEIINDG